MADAVFGRREEASWMLPGDIHVSRWIYGTRGCAWAYRVVGTWDQLSDLGICNGVELPAAPKRTRCSFGTKHLAERDWSIRAVKGRRWELSLWQSDGMQEQSIERAIAQHLADSAPTRGHLRLVWSAPQ